MATGRFLLSRFPSTFAIIVEEVLGSTAVDNAPPHPQTIRSGDFFVVTGREQKQAKAGYHYGSGILPFAIFNSVWYTRLSPVNWKLWR